MPNFPGLSSDYDIDNPNLSIDDWIGKGKSYNNVPDIVLRELLQRLSMPEGVEAILPSATLSVRQLLATSFSTQIQPMLLISPSTCFSEIEPNTDLGNLLHRPMPCRAFLTQLQGMAGQAMLDGKKSIKDWTRKGVYLPFSALTFWYSLLCAASSKNGWSNARSWIVKQKLSPTLLGRFDRVLACTAWKDSIGSLGSFVTVADMAAFLSSEMLSESHIDAMLLRLRIRIQESHPNLANDSLIILTDFTQSLTAIPVYKNRFPTGATTSLTRTASQFLDGDTYRDIWTVAYSEPVHFGALHIHKLDDRVTMNWGDSIGRSQPTAMTQGLTTWVSHYVPQAQLEFIENLECASQTDDYSCSIISVNTIKHATLNRNEEAAKGEGEQDREQDWEQKQEQEREQKQEREGEGKGEGEGEGNQEGEEEREGVEDDR